MNANTTLPDT